MPGLSPGKAVVFVLQRLPPDELIARILELEDRNRQLVQRVEQLEELFRLAQDRRFAPSSEKLKDRIFDEAEPIVATQCADEDDQADDACALPDTGLAEPDKPAPGKRGRKRLPAYLPRQRIDYDLPETQKVCPGYRDALHRIGEEISDSCMTK